MNRITARRVARTWQGGDGTALDSFARIGLVHRRRKLRFELDAEIIGVQRNGRSEQLPELSELRDFVDGVLVCVVCDSEIDPHDLAEFAQYETEDGVVGEAHTSCAATDTGAGHTVQHA